jgi:hypothetical protein
MADTIYDPIAKRRLTPQEEAIVHMYITAALQGIMSRSPTELELLTPEQISKIVMKQALSLLNLRKDLTNMKNVLKD